MHIDIFGILNSIRKTWLLSDAEAENSTDSDAFRKIKKVVKGIWASNTLVYTVNGLE